MLSEDIPQYGALNRALLQQLLVMCLLHQDALLVSFKAYYMLLGQRHARCACQLMLHVVLQSYLVDILSSCSS